MKKTAKPSKRVNSKSQGQPTRATQAPCTIDDWIELVNEACQAKTAKELERLYAKADSWQKLPIDCANDDERSKVKLEALWKSVAEKFAKRKRQLQKLHPAATMDNPLWKLQDIEDLFFTT